MALLCGGMMAAMAEQPSAAQKGLDAMAQKIAGEAPGYEADYWTAMALRTSAKTNDNSYYYMMPAVNKDADAADALELTPAIFEAILNGHDPTDINGRDFVAELLALQQTDGGFDCAGFNRLARR